MATQWSAALVGCVQAGACDPPLVDYLWRSAKLDRDDSLFRKPSVSDMLTYAALAIIFMIVTIAVPHMAASIAGGTVGLALSHAFEAAFIAQTVIRPITSALQTGFNKVAQLGNAGAGSSSEATGWVNAMDFGRQTQRLGNLGTDGGQRVPAPKDVRGTSVMPSRAPNTTPMNPGTARYGNPNTSTTAMSKATSKI